jgi:hypothetical protein
MITQKEKNTIIKTLGKHYTNSILLELEKKQIFNTNGQPYLAANIRKLVAGDWENETLEIEILKLVNSTMKSQQKAAEKRKKLIQKPTP